MFVNNFDQILTTFTPPLPDSRLDQLVEKVKNFDQLIFPKFVLKPIQKLAYRHPKLTKYSAYTLMALAILVCLGGVLGAKLAASAWVGNLILAAEVGGSGGSLLLAQTLDNALKRRKELLKHINKDLFKYEYIEISHGRDKTQTSLIWNAPKSQ